VLARPTATGLHDVDQASCEPVRGARQIERQDCVMLAGGRFSGRGGVLLP